MKARRVLESLFGATLIYTIMAACNGSINGGSGHGGHAMNVGGSSAASRGGNNGTMNGSGGSNATGIMDALMDPVSDAEADPMSGTRLKGKFISGADGSKQYTPNVWFDSLRNEDCAFHLAADGTLRCLPTNLTFLGLGYKDAQCTQAFVWIAAPQPGCQAIVTAYVGTYDAPPTCGVASADDLGEHVYPMGQLTTLTTSYGFVKATAPTNCLPASGGPSGAIPFDVGDEVKAKSFVSGVAGVDP